MFRTLGDTSEAVDALGVIAKNHLLVWREIMHSVGTFPDASSAPGAPVISYNFIFWIDYTWNRHPTPPLPLLPPQALLP